MDLVVALTLVVQEVVVVMVAQVHLAVHQVSQLAVEPLLHLLHRPHLLVVVVVVEVAEVEVAAQAPRHRPQALLLRLHPPLALVHLHLVDHHHGALALHHHDKVHLPLLQPKDLIKDLHLQQVVGQPRAVVGEVPVAAVLPVVAPLQHHLPPHRVV